MKKVSFLKVLGVLWALVGFSWSISAQTDAFNKDDKVINVGIGLGSYISYTDFSISVPPISGSFEYGIVDLFDKKGGVGIGGYLGYILYKNKFDNSMKVSDLVIGPRGLFHYQFVDKLDTYAGVMLGYDVKSYSRSSDLPGSGFYATYFLGARYYLTSAIAIYGELGYGVAPLEIGVAYKFQ